MNNVEQFPSKKFQQRKEEMKKVDQLINQIGMRKEVEKFRKKMNAQNNNVVRMK